MWTIWVVRVLSQGSLAVEEGGRSQNQSEEDVSMENRHRDAKLLSLKMERGGLETRNVGHL